MSVNKNKKATAQSDTALIEATLFIEDSVFVQDSCYLFEAIDEHHMPLTDDVNIDDFKAAVDHYFTRILKTKLYLKSIPRCSSLCNKEFKLFLFE
jgi:hypothetical protein